MMSGSATHPVRPDIAPPEPNLTFAEMLRRAEAMRGSLRERQQRCEELGRIPEETHADFLNAGFYRALQPRRFGGYEFSMSDFVRLVMEISRGCIDSGWVLGLIASEPAALLPLFPDQTQHELYGPQGDCRVAIAVAPGGSAIPDAAGYRVSGTWDYCSGCDIATHVQASVLLSESATQPPKGMAIILFDRKHCEIVDNWNVVGMQGTGSRRVVVGERTLAAHRVLPLEGDLRWRRGGSPLAAGGFAAYAVATGAARGALDVYEGILRNKKWVAPPFPMRFEMPELQQHFGGAQALVDTAEAALLSLADRYSEICRVSREKKVSSHPEDVRRIHRAGLQCMDLSWQAVELLFRTGGSASAAKNSPLGRYFRGVAVARTHVGFQHDHVSINIARLHFGLPVLSPL